MKKKILVTGGLGFIGSNFINHILKDKKFKILNLDNKSLPVSNHYKIFKTKNYNFKKIDITNFKKTQYEILKFKPNRIINFAAETHVDNSISNPKKFINTNIIGTFNLLEASRNYFKNNNNFVFIHISTDEVFGDLEKSTKGFNETTRYNPSSPYSASKASSDFLVRSWARTFKIPAIITNTSNNYGPYQYEEKLVPLSIKKILNKEKIPIYGSGKQERDWIFVLDHVLALKKILLKGKINNTYLIGSGKTIKNINLIKIIHKEISKQLENSNFKVNTLDNSIKFIKNRPGHDYKYLIDNSKISKQLKWKTEYDIKKGVSMTVKWYLDNTNWLK